MIPKVNKPKAKQPKAANAKVRKAKVKKFKVAKSKAKKSKPSDNLKVKKAFFKPYSAKVANALAAEVDTLTSKLDDLTTGKDDSSADKSESTADIDRSTTDVVPDRRANITAANARTRLLSLPGELRNNIYEEVAFGRILEVENGRLGPGLDVVCKQLRQEYLLMRKEEVSLASKIVFTVFDFDFSEIIYFINGLSKGELSSIEFKDNLQIVLLMTKPFCFKEVEPKFKIWLDFNISTFSKHMLHSGRFVWLAEGKVSLSDIEPRGFVRTALCDIIRTHYHTRNQRRERDICYVQVQTILFSHFIRSKPEHRHAKLQQITRGPFFPSTFTTNHYMRSLYPVSPHSIRKRDQLASDR